MQLNPYNFKQYLTKAGPAPQLGGWAIALLTLAFWGFWSSPYIAPESVAFRLPTNPSAKASDKTSLGLKNPPSAFVVYTGNGFICKNTLYNTETLRTALLAIKDKQTLMIATASNTTLQELLPVLDRVGSLGFSEVLFTVRP
jgi:biopolymer transport protein ExbD